MYNQLNNMLFLNGPLKKICQFKNSVLITMKMILKL
jgi:hypothetical protein